LHMTRQQQPVTGAIGSTLRIPLDRVGIVTGVTLRFSAPVNVTVAATASPFAPYNLVKGVTYTDFGTIDRIKTNGYGLHAINCFRSGRMLNNANKLAGYIPGAGGIDTNILKMPVAVAADEIDFSLFLPIAYDAASDLRGAVMAQTTTGQHSVTIDLANAFVGADEFDSPYSAGTVASSSNVVVTPYLHYIMPQGNIMANLPMIDLSTVYALEGNLQDSSNIGAGQDKFINWPNNRAIVSALHMFDNGGSATLNGADIGKITLLANSNTNISELDPWFIRSSMRTQLGADLPSGVYYMGKRSQPISTQLFGNVQTKVGVLTANANAKFINQFESFYLAGTPLPGIIQ